MIRVSVHLLSAIDKSTTELARMDIWNDGRASVENPNLGDYQAMTYKGRSKAALDKSTPSKRAGICNWRRHDHHVWNLVRHMLDAMGYDKIGPKTAGTGGDDTLEALARALYNCNPLCERHGQGPKVFMAWDDLDEHDPAMAEATRECARISRMLHTDMVR